MNSELAEDVNNERDYTPKPKQLTQFCGRTCMSQKQPPQDDNGSDLLRDLLGDVKPLSHNKIDPDTAPKTPVQKTRQIKRSTTSGYAVRDYAPNIGADEILCFARDGVQPKFMSQLKKGQYPIDTKVDLHGVTIDQAGMKLHQAINNALSQQMRCLLVVHGRGKGSFDNKPAIKAHVDLWLRDTPAVLAFHSALPKHGGTGAVYVLLKRQREK